MRLKKRFNYHHARRPLYGVVVCRREPYTVWVGQIETSVVQTVGPVIVTEGPSLQRGVQICTHITEFSARPLGSSLLMILIQRDWL